MWMRHIYIIYSPLKTIFAMYRSVRYHRWTLSRDDTCCARAHAALSLLYCIFFKGKRHLEIMQHIYPSESQEYRKYTVYKKIFISKKKTRTSTIRSITQERKTEKNMASLLLYAVLYYIYDIFHNDDKKLNHNMISLSSTPV